MTLDDFKEFGSLGFNHVPVTREVLADLDTPLSAYLKLADGAYSYLFESVHGGEQWGRYSIIGLPCQVVVKVTGSRIDLEKSGEIVESVESGNPFEWIKLFAERYKVPEIAGLPRFNGGLVGYFGYETIGYIEPRLRSKGKPDPIGTPDIVLMVSEDMLVFDNLTGKLLLITHGDPANTNSYQRCQERLDELVTQARLNPASRSC